MFMTLPRCNTRQIKDQSNEVIMSSLHGVLNKGVPVKGLGIF